MSISTGPASRILRLGRQKSMSSSSVQANLITVLFRKQRGNQVVRWMEIKQYSTFFVTDVRAAGEKTPAVDAAGVIQLVPCNAAVVLCLQNKATESGFSLEAERRGDQTHTNKRDKSEDCFTKPRTEEIRRLFPPCGETDRDKKHRNGGS